MTRANVCERTGFMEDKEIVDLYWARQEQAIEETERKYGRYLRSIAYHILNNTEDTEEIGRAHV